MALTLPAHQVAISVASVRLFDGILRETSAHESTITVSQKSPAQAHKADLLTGTGWTQHGGLDAHGGVEGCGFDPHGPLFITWIHLADRLLVHGSLGLQKHLELSLWGKRERSQHLLSSTCSGGAQKPTIIPGSNWKSPYSATAPLVLRN